MVEFPVCQSGGIHSDSRGTVSFMNDFDMSSIKRVYKITHPSVDIIRGWQGHLIESKWFLIQNGSFKFKIIKPDNMMLPKKLLYTGEFTINADNRISILSVPPGFVTSFRAMKANSCMLVFSDVSVDESKMDDFRFSLDNWNLWV